MQKFVDLYIKDINIFTNVYNIELYLATFNL